MYVSRLSDMREIVRGWEPGALDAEEYRRFSTFETRPPVVMVDVRCWRCFLPELPLPSRGMSVARMELVAFLVFCNSSCLMVLAMLRWESRLVLKWVRWEGMIGRVYLLAFLYH